MNDHWREPDRHAPLSGAQAADVVRRRIDHGMLETWFEHDRGRLLAVVSNGTRALIMLLEEPGDPGEHAIDPTGTGQQDGFVLGERTTDDDSRSATWTDAAGRSAQNL
ncbi:hypothetical protein [Micromonospora sp. RTP1Z1]|uniref:hypothetical protein n=1 Tax=Micromonospora sp. RTP1Z1 TaxID=2994043 RepID=UPI0029C74E59|nr:hypothetical protein [Micromonospora sp. RTP1Z1]